MNEEEQNRLVNELLLKVLMGFGYVTPEKAQKETAKKVEKVAKTKFKDTSDKYFRSSELSKKYSIPLSTLQKFIKNNKVKKIVDKNIPYYSLEDFTKKCNKIGFLERYS